VRLGIVSDIHGNAEALLTALDLMRPVDEIFCLGDSISQYRFSNDVVGLLRDRNVTTILGNHEEIFFSDAGARARDAKGIDQELLNWLAARPRQLELDISGKRIILAHSTPWPPGGDYVYDTSANFTKFGAVAADIVMYGHTHQPLARRVGTTLVINPGSVGEGRPTRDGFLHSCAVLDLENDAVDILDFSPQDAWR